MFENLTNKLEGILNKLKKAPSLNETQVETGLKEIREALLAADVSLPVVKKFIEEIKPKAIGQEIIRSTSPGQMLVKIVYDQLVQVLGGKSEELNLKAVPPASILLRTNSYFAIVLRLSNGHVIKVDKTTIGTIYKFYLYCHNTSSSRCCLYLCFIPLVCRSVCSIHLSCSNT